MGGKHMDKNFVALRIIELMEPKSMTEYGLSSALGRSNSYINKIVSQQAYPSMESFFDICDIFQITPADFFNSDISLNDEKFTNFLNTARTLNKDDLNLIMTLTDRLSKKPADTQKK